jgi:NAD-dependent deacetylase
MQIGEIAWRRGIAVVDVNPEDNPFAQMARSLERGFAARGSACDRLPEIAEALAC